MSAPNYDRSTALMVWSLIAASIAHILSSALDIALRMHELAAIF